MYLNIAVHEIGHLLFRPFGEFTMLFMGSGFEVLFPFVVGAYFLVRKRDLVSSHRLGLGGERPGQCRYLHRRRGRRSIGAAGSHRARCGWRLGADPGVEFFDKVYLADGIAGVVRTVGFVLWGVALCLAVWAIVPEPTPRTGGRSRSEGTGDRGASRAARPHPRGGHVALTHSGGPSLELEYDAAARTRGSVVWLAAPSSSNGSGRCRCSPPARLVSSARSQAW